MNDKSVGFFEYWKILREIEKEPDITLEVIEHKNCINPSTVVMVKGRAETGITHDSPEEGLPTNERLSLAVDYLKAIGIEGLSNVQVKCRKSNYFSRRTTIKVSNFTRSNCHNLCGC